jgi:NRPS condensation-like uncharacterized protein
MKKTTIEIYADDMPTLKAWKKSYKVSMADFIRAWIATVKQHKQREFYNSLPMPSDFRKVLPLQGKHIDKCKVVKYL